MHLFDGDAPASDFIISNITAKNCSSGELVGFDDNDDDIVTLVDVARFENMKHSRKSDINPPPPLLPHQFWLMGAIFKGKLNRSFCKRVRWYGGFISDFYILIKSICIQLISQMHCLQCVFEGYQIYAVCVSRARSFIMLSGQISSCFALLQLWLMITLNAAVLKSHLRQSSCYQCPPWNS